MPTQNALHFWSHLASSLLLKRSLRSQNCKLLIFRQNLKSQRPGQGSYNTSQRNCCRKGGGKIRSNEEIFFAKMTVMWCHEFSFFQWWCLSEAWLIFDICGIFGQKCRSEVLSFCLLSMSIFLEQGAWTLFFLTLHHFSKLGFLFCEAFKSPSFIESEKRIVWAAVADGQSNKTAH